ncbi:hypothetical protein Ancab_023357 [Ancistrocladus abbreviatus]
MHGKWVGVLCAAHRGHDMAFCVRKIPCKARGDRGWSRAPNTGMENGLIVDKGKQPADYSGQLKDRTITTLVRIRKEDQCPPKRIRIRPPASLAPTPLPTPIPSTPFLTIHPLVVPSLVPATGTLEPKPASPMSTAIGSLTLDHLIDEVKLVLRIDLFTQGDAVNIKSEIDDPIMMEGG